MGWRALYKFCRQREAGLTILGLWLIDLSADAYIPNDAQLCNSLWCWPATRVFHAALWALAAVAILRVGRSEP